MKRLVFAAVIVTGMFVPIVISEGQVMPVCSIIEETNENVDNSCNEKTYVNYEANDEFENYIVGVVAGEMPWNFPHEALKAQAVAARTYAVRQLESNANTKYEDIAQAYVSMNTMKKMWGNNFEKYYCKIKNAVYSTKGEILEYNNEPILAAFCSTTNGYTENCEDVWTQSLPYLTSVKSEGEEFSPYYSDKVVLSKKKFTEIFGGVNVSNWEKTGAGYVKAVKINGNLYTGNRIRQILGLKSTSFEINISGDDVIISTKGYGHGVGMSQYGACYLANNGSDYKEILQHYYKGAILKNL